MLDAGSQVGGVGGHSQGRLNSLLSFTSLCLYPRTTSIARARSFSVKATLFLLFLASSPRTSSELFLAFAPKIY